MIWIYFDVSLSVCASVKLFMSNHETSQLFWFSMFPFRLSSRQGGDLLHLGNWLAQVKKH